MNWMTAKEVAERFGVNISTVRTHIERNKFGDGQRKTGTDQRDIWLIREDAAKALYGEDETE